MNSPCLVPSTPCPDNISHMSTLIVDLRIITPTPIRIQYFSLKTSIQFRDRSECSNIDFPLRKIPIHSNRGTERVESLRQGAYILSSFSSFGGYVQVERSGRRLGVGGRQEPALSKQLVAASRSGFHKVRETFNYRQQWPRVRALVMFDPTEERFGRAGRLTRARDAYDRYKPGPG